MKRGLGSLGESGLIGQIKRSLPAQRDVVVGPGDDCAVVRKDRLTYGLFTTDMLVEDVDFRRSDRADLVGEKAVKASVSDIAACGGTPRFCTVAAGLPRTLGVGTARSLCQGILRACRQWKVSLVGGDISRARQLVLDVSMYGEVPKKDLVLRSGARTGDFIFVTGPLGGSQRGRHLRFRPRLAEAHALLRAVKVHAMIDISDGLAQDLGHLLEASGRGAVLYEAVIPVSKDAGALAGALYDGEDFELLYTVSARDARKLLRARVPYALPVGEVVDKKRGVTLVSASGRVRPLDVRKGFRHF